MLINILSIVLLVASVLILNNPDSWFRLVQPAVRPPSFRHNFADILDAYKTDIPILPDTSTQTDASSGTDIPTGAGMPVGTDILIETEVPVDR